MSVAYCIAADGHREVTRRLIDRVLRDDPTGHVVLHTDSRQGSVRLRGLDPARTHLMPERPIYWGGFELVALQTEMVELAYRRGHDFAVLLSGQDYPLFNLGRLEEALSCHDVWAQIEPMTDEGGECTWPEGRRRYYRNWVRLSKGQPAWPLRKLNRAAAMAHILPVSSCDWPGPPVVSYYQLDEQLWWGLRSKGPDVPVFYGSNWMSLSRAAMAAVCSAPASVMSYFRRTAIPDEACFHTILANAGGLTFAPGNQRYIRFRAEASHPDVLTIADVDDMRSSGADFARKFDASVDAGVLDLLDGLAALEPSR